MAQAQTQTQAQTQAQIPIRLPEFFQDGMVFQRDKPIHLWGEAIPGAAITAAFRKDAQILSDARTVADTDGHFSLSLKPLSASEHLSLDFQIETTEALAHTGETVLTLTDISFGDVWLAGGQSNMEFFLKYDQDYASVKALPKNAAIHMYNMPQRAFEGHETHNKSGYGKWFRDGEVGTETFSAPAYQFAREIQKETGIPIGIIGCNWGGTPASAWVPEEVLQQEPLTRYLKEYERDLQRISPEKCREESLGAWAFLDSDAQQAAFEPLLYGRDRAFQLTYMKEHEDDPVVPMGPYNANRPSGLYHTMLSKLIPFSIRGVLWYQGESDAGDRAPYYDVLFSSLIADWRKEWNDDFPFLFVQLAPFGEWLSCDNKGYATVRRKQQQVADTVPGAYMAGIMDLGSYYDIHPKAKLEVGRRLSLLARKYVYGESALLADAPSAAWAYLADAQHIMIRLAHADGLSLGNGDSDFDIYPNGPEWEAFAPESVQILDDSLLLTLPESFLLKSDALYVALGNRDYAEIHICNKAGLTALPFCMKVQGTALN